MVRFQKILQGYRPGAGSSSLLGGSKLPNIWVSGTKNHSDYSISDLKPYYLGTWTLLFTWRPSQHVHEKKSFKIFRKKSPKFVRPDLSGLWLAGNAGMEKNMETSISYGSKYEGFTGVIMETTI